jgi:hypothetical protein
MPLKFMGARRGLKAVISLLIQDIIYILRKAGVKKAGFYEPGPKN